MKTAGKVRDVFFGGQTKESIDAWTFISPPPMHYPSIMTEWASQ